MPPRTLETSITKATPAVSRLLHHFRMPRDYEKEEEGRESDGDEQLGQAEDD